MQGYETVFITHPDLSEDELSGALNKLKESITKNSGELVKELVWGRRRLAYQIANQNFGIYHVWYLTGDQSMLDELQRQFNYSDQILRYQTIKAEDLEAEASFFLELKNIQDAAAAKKRKPVIPVHESGSEKHLEETEKDTERVSEDHSEEEEIVPELDASETESETASEPDAEPAEVE